MKEAVFPFLRYQGSDIALGPEMKSTGEVMGIDADLGLAYAKSQMAAPPALPKGGNIFISVKDGDKQSVIPLAREFVGPRFRNHRDERHRGHARGRGRSGDQGSQDPRRPAQRARPDQETATSISSSTRRAERSRAKTKSRMRNASLARKIPIMTTMRAAQASANGIRSLQRSSLQVKTLQEYHQALKRRGTESREQSRDAISELNVGGRTVGQP